MREILEQTLADMPCACGKQPAGHSLQKIASDITLRDMHEYTSARCETECGVCQERHRFGITYGKR